MNKAFLTLPFSILLVASQALCWGDLGHSIVGAVAEQNLSPRAKNLVRGVLGVEPLSTAAVWPDHVRDDERFSHKHPNPEERDSDIHDFANFHFCEIPVGFTYDNKPIKDVKDCYGAISKAAEILKSPLTKNSREVKMIALRYLVHVVGDIHQPLHIGNGLDRGGNSCSVRWKNPTAPVNFHSFWDETLVQYLGTTYADPQATPPRKGALYMGQYLENMKRVRPEMFTAQAKAEAYKGGLKQWLLESQALRESGVYPDVPEQMKDVPKGEEPKHRPYCAWYSNQETSVVGEGSPLPGKIPVEAMPMLSEETYVKPYSKVVETQLLKAGLRLAAILDDVATNASKPQFNIDDSNEEKVIRKVQDSFRNRP